MERLYEEYVTRYSDSFIRVFVDQEYVIRIKSFVKKIIEAKSKETHHKIDSLQEEKRFTESSKKASVPLGRMMNCSFIYNTDSCSIDS